MGGGVITRIVWRTGGLASALLALALLVAVPPGYMPGVENGRAGLHICTGHGLLTIGGGDHKAPPAHGAQDTPCVFAGAATPPAPPLVPLAQPDLAAYALVQDRGIADAAPGRGLAAPPPPSHGPPILSI